MTAPTPLKPFPNPVPPQDLGVNAIMTRGNDNLLAGKINEVITYATGIAGDIPTDVVYSLTNEMTLDLLIYAFRRIKFLEDALNVQYGPQDFPVPDSFSLLEVDI